MGITEKIAEVALHSLSGNIILYKEGMFWKAYQQSSYLFVKNIKEYLVLKKHIKSASTDIVSLGFPVPSLDKVLGERKYEIIDNVKVLVSLCAEYQESDYASWIESIPIAQNNQPTHKIQNKNLPVFKATYDLLLYIYQINKNISREYKFSLTEKIKSDILDILVCIYNVSTSDNKVSTISTNLQNHTKQYKYL